jgi:transcriptional regulator with AAA-type ATPase domain
MQLLLYSKNSSYPLEPASFDIDSGQSSKIPEICGGKGNVCLISQSAFGQIRKITAKKGFIDCGPKGEKIDLKRALKLDEKKNRELPRQVLFETSSAGAFKRGFKAFYTKHFTALDPSCLIIIPDRVYTAIMIELDEKSKQNKAMPDLNEPDPLLKLMNIPDSDPKIRRIAESFIGSSLKVRNVRALVYKASMTDSPVLILGESGTGKDVIASQIFYNSATYKKDFFRINCSALPESLLEGELFGYRKGSFTGASTDREGLFSAAENGTIFLDEIGDLSLQSQVKILHAVEKKEIRQIGSSKTRPVNVRIIAATNRNIDAMMIQDTFREDLYYRISTFRINTPALREHPEDIPLIAESYWRRKQRKSRLTADFLDSLKDYSWPGNVRELNSLLNSIVDYFGDISPTQAHVDAIRKSRQEMVIQPASRDRIDPSQDLKIRSQNTLLNVQNIIRSVKIEINNYISENAGIRYNEDRGENLKRFILSQTRILSELCLEPANFNQWEIFEATLSYRQLLEKAVDRWRFVDEKPVNLWDQEMKKLEDQINDSITDAFRDITDR